MDKIIELEETFGDGEAFGGRISCETRCLQTAFSPSKTKFT